MQASPTGHLRILSWNLLHGTGTDVSDVAKLIVEHRPDLVLMQEAQNRLDDLPALVGGRYIRCEMDRRSHGVAAWSPFPITTKAVDLPLATRFDLPMPIFRLVARRMALSVRVGDFKVVIIHLDHGPQIETVRSR